VFSLAARATRRQRLAVIGAMSFLFVLVVAAGVALVMIRNAQQEATAQAERVRDQLVRTRAAEISANAANQKLESQNASLVAAIEDANRARVEAEGARTEAEEARRRAEASKRHERRSRHRATKAAQRARAAAAAVKLANDRLAVLLEQERRRVQELEDLTRGAKIIPDVRLDLSDEPPATNHTPGAGT
jgi:hypothetical protein